MVTFGNFKENNMKQWVKYGPIPVFPGWLYVYEDAPALWFWEI